MAALLQGSPFFLLYFHSTFGQFKKGYTFFRHASHRTTNQSGTFILYTYETPLDYNQQSKMLVILKWIKVIDM